MHTLIYHIPTTASHLSSPPSPYLTTSPLPKSTPPPFPSEMGRSPRDFNSAYI